jgi:hypothetical protein
MSAHTKIEWEALTPEERRSAERYCAESLYAFWFGAFDRLAEKQIHALAQVIIDLKNGNISQTDAKAFVEATAGISDIALRGFDQWDEWRPELERVIDLCCAELTPQETELLLPVVDKMTDIGLCNLLYLRRFRRSQEKRSVAKSGGRLWKELGHSTNGQLCQGLRPGSNGTKEVVAK